MGAEGCGVCAVTLSFFGYSISLQLFLPFFPFPPLPQPNLSPLPPSHPFALLISCCLSPPLASLVVAVQSIRHPTTALAVIRGRGRHNRSSIIPPASASACEWNIQIGDCGDAATVDDVAGNTCAIRASYPTSDIAWRPQRSPSSLLPYPTLSPATFSGSR